MPTLVPTFSAAFIKFPAAVATVPPVPIKNPAAFPSIAPTPGNNKPSPICPIIPSLPINLPKDLKALLIPLPIFFTTFLTPLKSFLKNPISISPYVNNLSAKVTRVLLEVVLPFVAPASLPIAVA